MAIIAKIVTIQLQPFVLYINLALKNSYWTGIWLSNIIIDGNLAKKRGGKTTMRVGELGSLQQGLECQSSFVPLKFYELKYCLYSMELEN